VAMQEHADRLIAMGEEPGRVFVTGDPALDEIGRTPRKSRDELAALLRIPLVDPVAAVTMHPDTIERTGPLETRAALDALDDWPGTVIITYPGADAGWHEVAAAVESFARTHPRTVAVPSLGRQNYYSLLDFAAVMLGNTSSGIWEAATFRLPVVNVGDRQKGRHRTANVIDVAADVSAIRRALDTALSPDFKASLAGLTNPYGDGRAAERIVSQLGNMVITPRLFRKSA
jgi:UDP-hydrolysing UDP-N-acetyl-D-glucosamine 2-epimerase